MPQFHLAQLNIGRMLYPLDDERMYGFVSRLDAINALAEASPGFVWRLVGDGNDATSLRPYPDDMMIVNMSVWDSVESLKTYTYKSQHATLFKDRKLWFEFPSKAHFAMWWVPAGHQPTVAEAKERLDHLQAHGPSPFAFTFKQHFAAPE